MFKCDHFEKEWCEERNIRPRFGAVNRGKNGLTRSAVLALQNTLGISDAHLGFPDGILPAGRFPENA